MFNKKRGDVPSFSQRGNAASLIQEPPQEQQESQQQQQKQQKETQQKETKDNNNNNNNQNENKDKHNKKEDKKKKEKFSLKIFGTMSKKEKSPHPSLDAVNSSDEALPMSSGEEKDKQNSVVRLVPPGGGGGGNAGLLQSTSVLPSPTLDASSPSNEQPSTSGDNNNDQGPSSAPAPDIETIGDPQNVVQQQQQQLQESKNYLEQKFGSGENNAQARQNNPGIPPLNNNNQPAQYIPQRYFPQQQQQQCPQAFHNGYQQQQYGGYSYQQSPQPPQYSQYSGGPSHPQYYHGTPPPMGGYGQQPRNPGMIITPAHPAAPPPQYHQQAHYQAVNHLADQLHGLEMHKQQYLNSVAPPMMHHPQAQMGPGAPPPGSPVLQHSASQLPQNPSSPDTSSTETDEWEVEYEELEISKEIARGSFGVVFQGYFRGTDVAVKKLLVQNLSQEQQKEFIDEINMMKKLHHPNVVLLIGVCTKPPNRCIITEFCTGSMWNLLHDKNVRVDAKLQYKLIFDTTKGMNYLHLFRPPVLHRDLKSANLLVDQNFNVKIADFGLARMKAQLMTGNLGTCQYMAPEVIQSQEYSEKADVFSFAVVMWEVLSRQGPYQGMQPMQIAYGVVHQNLRPPIPAQAPPSLVNIMTMCWAQDPAQRPTFPDILKMLKTLNF